MSKTSWHHPNYDNPHWVLLIKNFLFHKTLTIIQRMKPTVENVMYIRQYADAIEYEYLRKREIVDVAEGIGADSNAVKKAVEAFAKNREEV